MTLYEYYNEADPSMTWVHGDFWQGQTFTPQVAHTITKVKLMMYRHGSPGTITVGIRATDVDGHPTGADICSGTTDGDTLPLIYRGEWREITLGAGAALSVDVKYAIVVRALSGDQNNYVRWLHAVSAPYGRGAHEFSSDSGTSWDTDAGKDLKFKEYGSL